MATSTKKKTGSSKEWKLSWRRLIIFGSFAANIGFLVILLTFAMTHVLDGMVMPVALERYCSTANDDKFKASAPKVKALRHYVCDREDADPYFKEGLQKYLDSKYLSY